MHINIYICLYLCISITLTLHVSLFLSFSLSLSLSLFFFLGGGRNRDRIANQTQPKFGEQNQYHNNLHAADVFQAVLHIALKYKEIGGLLSLTRTLFLTYCNNIYIYTYTYSLYTHIYIYICTHKKNLSFSLSSHTYK